jgi:hypothetical protein
MDFRELIKFREYTSPQQKDFLNLMELMESIYDPDIHQPLEEEIGINLRQSSLIEFRNGLVLSVFGSNTGYCIPRRNIDVYEYSALEIAFYYMKDNGYRNGDFLEISTSEELREFNKKEVLGEFFHNEVYRCVPIILIQEVFDFLKDKYELITIEKGD